MRHIHNFIPKKKQKKRGISLRLSSGIIWPPYALSANKNVAEEVNAARIWPQLISGPWTFFSLSTSVCLTRFCHLSVLTIGFYALYMCITVYWFLYWALLSFFFDLASYNEMNHPNRVGNEQWWKLIDYLIVLVSTPILLVNWILKGYLLDDIVLEFHWSRLIIY